MANDAKIVVAVEAVPLTELADTGLRPARPVETYYFPYIDVMWFETTTNLVSLHLHGDEVAEAWTAPLTNMTALEHALRRVAQTGIVAVREAE